MIMVPALLLLPQVTMKKLEKLNAPTNDKNKEALAMERIDQVRHYGFFPPLYHRNSITFNLATA